MRDAAVYAICIGVLLFNIGCGEETTNTDPVINSFHAEPANVYPNDQVILTVSAADAENENLPYTMTPEMVADAAKTFKPEILYPYHFGNTDTSKLVDLLAEEREIEVRIRDME